MSGKERLSAPADATLKKRLQALHNADSQLVPATVVAIRQLTRRDPATATVVAIINARLRDSLYAPARN